MLRLDLGYLAFFAVNSFFYSFLFGCGFAAI